MTSSFKSSRSGSYGVNKGHPSQWAWLDKRNIKLSVLALGITYGDLGTSPLYTYTAIMQDVKCQYSGQVTKYTDTKGNVKVNYVAYFPFSDTNTDKTGGQLYFI